MSLHQFNKLSPKSLALWAALPMAQTSQVESRLKMILDKSRSRRLPKRGAIAFSVMLTVGLALAVATAQIHQRQKFSDKDPEASKAYYEIGSAQMLAGRCDEALASFNKSIALPESTNALISIHSVARYERINILEDAGRYGEAASDAQALLKNKGRGLIAADLWENLRERLPEFKMMRDDQANRAAEKGQYSALKANPKWTQTLSNGVTVQLLGVMQSVRNVHSIWSPEAKLISHVSYKALADTDGYQPYRQSKELGLILRFQYPTGQAILTEYEATGSMGSRYRDGLTHINGSVATDENTVNWETAGCRYVATWLPPKQGQTTLRVGITLVPPPFGPIDPPDAPNEWVEFSNIILPQVKL